MYSKLSPCAIRGVKWMSASKSVGKYMLPTLYNVLRMKGKRTKSDR